MIQSLLILLVGIGIGMAAAGRLSRRRTGEREVRVQVHELELMTEALVRAKSALIEAYARHPTMDGFRALIADALSAVKLALGEGNGHAVKHDDRRANWV